MGRMDTITKEYLSDNSVFADVLNFSIYNGRNVIQPENLRELDTSELVLPFGSDHVKTPVQRYRDVLKAVVGQEDQLAVHLLVGTEGQTDIHYAMPVKTMVYDSLQLAKQVDNAKASFRKKNSDVKLSPEEFLSGFRKTDKLVPVLTLVVYFGAKKWDAPLDLWDMMDIRDPALLPFIPNYRVNLIDPARISDNDFEKFRSGLGAVLMCIKHSQDSEFDVLRNDMYENLDFATANLIKEISGMNIEIGEYEEEGVYNMCKAFENSQRLAKAEGRAEGELNKSREIAFKLRSQGFGEERISEIVSVELSQIREWFGSTAV